MWYVVSVTALLASYWSLWCPQWLVTCKFNVLNQPITITDIIYLSISPYEDIPVHIWLTNCHKHTVELLVFVFLPWLLVFMRQMTFLYQEQKEKLTTMKFNLLWLLNHTPGTMPGILWWSKIIILYECNTIIALTKFKFRVNWNWWCDFCSWGIAQGRKMILQENPSMLLPLCDGTASVAGRFPSQRANNADVCREYSVYAPSQWETTLHCNVVSHWLGSYANDPRFWCLRHG